MRILPLIDVDTSVVRIEICQYVPCWGMPTAHLVPSDRATLPLLTDCCTPVVRQVIKPDEAVTLAAGFKALSDPARPG